MDHPTTLIELMQLYPTEDACRRALFEHRWPGGFSCPRCGHRRAWHLSGRDLYECARCHYQGSLTAGTVLARTRTDLRKWFLAIWLLASTKKAPSAAELSRQLGVTVKTAWLMRRKITHAMSRAEGELMLTGLVELDEAFVGGKRSGQQTGRRQPRKAMIVVAAERTPAGGYGRAHLLVVADGSAATLGAAAGRTVRPASRVRTDGWSGCAGLGAAGYRQLPRTLARGRDIDEWLPWSHPSCSPTSSAGRSTSSTASRPATCRPTSTSSATDDCAASAATSSGAS